MDSGSFELNNLFGAENEWADSGHSRDSLNGENWMQKVDVSRFAEEITPSIQSLTHQRQKKPQSSYPKPTWSYSCLIALALKNSKTGKLAVAEIYSFICEHFPYFRTAAPGWKNSVRHNLSLNKCFSKIELFNDSHGRKSCLWTIRPEKMDKMELDIKKWKEKDEVSIVEGMANPDYLTAIEEGRHGQSNVINVKEEQFDRNINNTKHEDVVFDEPCSSSSIFNMNKSRPSILNRSSVKRRISCVIPSSSSPPLTNPLTELSSSLSYTNPSSPTLSSLDILSPPSRPSTPDIQTPLDLIQFLSPIPSIEYGYGKAASALTDNSLLVSALNASPYRATTFPSTLSL